MSKKFSAAVEDVALDLMAKAMVLKAGISSLFLMKGKETFFSSNSGGQAKEKESAGDFRVESGLNWYMV